LDVPDDESSLTVSSMSQSPFHTRAKALGRI